jgi:hypothetical protein
MKREKMTENKNISDEIIYNIKDIYKRIYILYLLTYRRIFNQKKRTQENSYQEYDHYWENFWESKDFFNTVLNYTQFDKPISHPMTPFEFKRDVIIKILEDHIKEYEISTVLEIGSGAGLNLVFLALRFPDVQFFGLEPTPSGVSFSHSLMANPPSVFNNGNIVQPIKNVKIIQGNILDSNTISTIRNTNYDLLFSCAVFEQLNNYQEKLFSNIQSLDFKYFLFYEEWLEANTFDDHYFNLVKWDYFRLSWNYLNKYDDMQIIDRFIPGLQPSWLKYGVVFGRKTQSEH